MPKAIITKNSKGSSNERNADNICQYVTYLRSLRRWMATFLCQTLTQFRQKNQQAHSLTTAPTHWHRACYIPVTGMGRCSKHFSSHFRSL